MNESVKREELAVLAKSLFDRGYSVGSAGNISVAVEDGLLERRQIPVSAFSILPVYRSSTATVTI